MKKLVSASLLAAGLALAGVVQAAPTTLLNVSYDVMRDFYKDYNAAFQKHWETEHTERQADLADVLRRLQQTSALGDRRPAG